MAWVHLASGQTTTRNNATAIAMFYPSRLGAFYLKGGIGIASHNYETLAGADRTSAGFGSTWGMGHDFRLGDNLYITPAIDLFFQTLDEDTGKATTSVVVFTVGLTWH